MQILDRRLNPSGRSLPNRQRFLRRAKYSQPTPSLLLSRCDAYPGWPRRMGAFPAARTAAQFL